METNVRDDRASMRRCARVDHVVIFSLIEPSTARCCHDTGFLGIKWDDSDVFHNHSGDQLLVVMSSLMK